MSKEITNIIPNCIEKIGEFTPARHREFRETMKVFLPFAIGWSMIRYIHKERMTDKQYKHEEIMFQMEHEERILQMELEHEEKMAEIKAKLLSREEESKDEKDN